MGKKNLKETIDQYRVNCNRIQEMADACEREGRERNEAEEAEFRALTRDNQILQMRIQANQIVDEPKPYNPEEEVRERLLNKSGAVTIQYSREVTPQTTEALQDTGILTVNEKEMLAPLRAGLIFEKVGLPVLTGQFGKLRWPKHTKATAKFAGEAIRLADSKIDFSKLETKPERLGIAIPVTREELEESAGVVEDVIRTEMPNAIADCVNEAMFSISADSAARNAKKVKGVFDSEEIAVTKLVTFKGALPTRKELLQIKAKVTSAGIALKNPAWVMTETMKAELEDLKIDAGSGRFLCEDGKIFGIPVFTTPVIGEGYIGFGDFSYAPSGFFGPMNVVVDPYTLARENSVDFVLNAHFASIVLREEAFVLGKVTSA